MSRVGEYEKKCSFHKKKKNKTMEQEATSILEGSTVFEQQ